MLREQGTCGLGRVEKKSLEGKYINLSGRRDLFPGEMEEREVRGGSWHVGYSCSSAICGLGISAPPPGDLGALGVSPW